ncbi:MAG: class I SAM-dependent methyltransferase [Chloroflexota bacterium]
MDETTGETRTWHYGLIARWWSEFNQAEPEELAYYGAAIRRFGEPALDLGCGTGRILLPLAAEGLDVDGVDVSGDMIDRARTAATGRGLTPGLFIQAGHDLDLARRYRTIYLCGVFGIGGRRDRDRETLHRAFGHLEPGGALIIWHEFPYADQGTDQWALWLAGRRDGLPRDWRETGDRRRAADGDEIELITRLESFDPFEQRQDLELRARLWRAGEVVREEVGRLSENLYFGQEILLLLEEAGFAEISVEVAYTGQPATPDDGTVVFIARKAKAGGA